MKEHQLDQHFVENVAQPFNLIKSYLEHIVIKYYHNKTTIILQNKPQQPFEEMFILKTIIILELQNKTDYVVPLDTDGWLRWNWAINGLLHPTGGVDEGFDL